MKTQQYIFQFDLLSNEEAGARGLQLEGPNDVHLRASLMVADMVAIPFRGGSPVELLLVKAFEPSERWSVDQVKQTIVQDMLRSPLIKGLSSVRVPESISIVRSKRLNLLEIERLELKAQLKRCKLELEGARAELSQRPPMHCYGTDSHGERCTNEARYGVCAGVPPEHCSLCDVKHNGGMGVRVSGL